MNEMPERLVDHGSLVDVTHTGDAKDQNGAKIYVHTVVLGGPTPARSNRGLLSEEYFYALTRTESPLDSFGSRRLRRSRTGMLNPAHGGHSAACKEVN